jgi:hypothetical protein
VIQHHRENHRQPERFPGLAVFEDHVPDVHHVAQQMKGDHGFLIAFMLDQDIDPALGTGYEGNLEKEIRIEFLKVFVDKGIFDIFQ